MISTVSLLDVIIVAAFGVPLLGYAVVQMVLARWWRK